MRILHVIPSLGDGGSERRLAYLSNELAHRGHGVDIGYLDDGPNRRLVDTRAVGLHRLKSLGNHDPGILWGLVRLIAKLEPDIVHTWLTQMDILGGIAARITRRKHVLSEPSCEGAYPATWKNSWRKWIGGWADALVANSEGGRAYWLDRIPSLRCYTIPNGLPLSDIELSAPGQPETYGFRSGTRVVLYVGRFDEVKNLELLAKALAKAMDLTEFGGILCGQGPTLPAVEKLAQDLGIGGRLCFPGFLPEVWPLMKMADVLVSVSTCEGRPNVVLEAMACECPIVVSDIPAHREFLDESIAVFVDPLDPDSVARGILDAITDSAGARCRAQRAKERVERWTVENMGREYEAMYRQILGC